MKAHELTPTYKRLRTYLIDVAKLQTESFSFGDMYGRVNGSFHAENIYQKISTEFKRIYFSFVKQATQVVVVNDYVLHLKFSEYAGDFQRLNAHLAYWAVQEHNVGVFDYKVTFNSESTVDINVYFDITEATILDDNGLKVC